MSGLAGLFRLDGSPLGPGELDSILAPLAHRGPDGSATWLDGSIGLGHQKLATDTEGPGRGPDRDAGHETLPLARAGGLLCITADARIDNREDLFAELAPRDPADASSDGALILLAYQRWGERCVERLLGDFAFAIWDGRSNALFCARDPFGVKPFYYHHQPGLLFAFASEVKGILGHTAVPRRLNDVRIGDFLARLFEDRTITFFEGVLRLPPAHTLKVDAQGLSLRQYWELDSGRDIKYASDEQYAEAFLSLFTEAVRCRLRGAAPAGALLSGGLDSSSIACVAAGLLAAEGRGPLETYSYVFPRSARSDERPYIEAVLSKGGMEPHWIDGDAVSPLSELDALLPHLDEPPYAWNIALTGATYRAAASSVRVLLDGLHGDNTLFSYSDFYLAELLRGGRFLELARLIRAHERIFPGRSWRSFKSYALKPLLPRRALAAWRRVRWGAPVAGPNLTQPDFARRVGIGERRGQLMRRFEAPFTDARQLHGFELTAGITTSALELADQLAAFHGIEPRYPFLDRRLVELCYGIPSRQKFLGGWPRSVLRRAMAGVLPDEIRWRRGKRGSGEWYVRNLAGSEGARTELLLGSGIRETAPYLNGDAVRAAYRDYQAAPALSRAASLWEPLVLADWLRRRPT